MWINLGLAVVVATLLCGCFQVEDNLTLNADGSGSVNLTVSIATMDGNYSSSLYPPLSEQAVHQLFPEKDFKVATEAAVQDDGSTLLTAKAAFKNIEALLNSPYAKAHALNLKVETNTLHVHAISGMAWIAQRAAGTNLEAMTRGIAGWNSIQKKSNEMRFSFKITLPKPVLAASGGNTEGQTASWSVEASKKSLTEAAQILSAPLDATCSAEGLAFAPKPIVRLNDMAFNDIPAGSIIESNSSAPDVQAVIKAARFEPQKLNITRTILYNSSVGGENQAVLQGNLVLPREMAPLKQQHPILTEARDNLGNDLTPRATSSSSRMERMQSFGSPAKKPTGKEYRQPINLNLKIPDWKATEIEKLEATVNLEYFGGQQRIKLTNALRSEWVLANTQSYQAHSILDPQLSSLGIKMYCNDGRRGMGNPFVSLNVTSTDTVLMDIQVYDASGKPLPQLRDSESDSGAQSQFTIELPQGITGPFSLVIQVKGSKTIVPIPIHLEHIPVSDTLKKP
jgi:hypothetical protein